MKKALLFIFSSALLALAGVVFNYSILNSLSYHDYSVWSYQIGLAFIVYAGVFEWGRQGFLRLSTSNPLWAPVYFRMSLFFLVLVLTINMVVSFLFADYHLFFIGYIAFHVLHETFLVIVRSKSFDINYKRLQMVKSSALFIFSAFLFFQIPEQFHLFFAFFLLSLYLFLFLFLNKFYNFIDFKLFLPKSNIFQKKKYVSLLSFSKPIFFVSFTTIAIFYIDRVFITYFNEGINLAENSAVSDFFKQIVMFPLTLLSVYFYKREVDAFTASGKNHLKKIVLKKLFLLVFFLIMLFWVIEVAQGYILSLYFPSYVNDFWDDNWFLFFVAYSLFSIKLIVLDQYFLVSKRNEIVAASCLINFFVLALLYIAYLYFEGVVKVAESFCIANFVSIVFYMVWSAKFNGREECEQ